MGFGVERHHVKDCSLLFEPFSGRAKLIGMVLSGAIAVAAAPASANTAAAADVTKPIEEAQSETLTSGDERFRQLFASWEALDESGPKGPAVVLKLRALHPARSWCEARNALCAYVKVGRCRWRARKEGRPDRLCRINWPFNRAAFAL